MNSLINEITKQQATSSVNINIMKEEMDNLSKNLEVSSEIIAFDQTIIDAISNKNFSIIFKETVKLGKTLKIENITVTDEGNEQYK